MSALTAVAAPGEKTAVRVKPGRRTLHFVAEHAPALALGVAFVAPLLIAVLTLGLGIGANAAIFSVVDAVVIRPLPYPESERLVGVWNDAPGINLRHFEQGDATYVLFRRENRVLEQMGIYSNGSVTLTGGQTPERIDAATVTGSLFTVLRVPPALGRTIQEGDEKPGAEKVVVLHVLHGATDYSALLFDE